MPIKTAVDAIRAQADISWAVAEFAAGALSQDALTRFLPKAPEPRAIMTLPGFMGPEFSMAPLNRFLGKLGYKAEGWGQGQNLGPQADDTFDYLLEMGQVLGDRIKRMSDETGTKVALIGQSLGGVYARELAFLMSDHIERVITLGSPAQLHPDTSHHTNRLITHGLKFTTGRDVEQHAQEQWMWNRESDIPPVPFVSIYSPFDGIVREDSVAISGEEMRRPSEHPRENVEVLCSHCGMAAGPLTQIAIADRLAIAPDQWKPFDIAEYVPRRLRHVARAWYPKALGYAHVTVN